MTHLTDLQLSMHADDALGTEALGTEALGTDEVIALTQHLETCAACQAKHAAMADEMRIIATALKTETTEQLAKIVVPKFSRPASLRGFAIANVATGLAVWAAQFLWKTLFGEIFMNAASRITSIYLPDVYEMMSTTALYYLQEGTAMFDAYLGFIVLSSMTLAVLWLALRFRKRRVALSLCALISLFLGGATLVAPVPVNALEIMRDEGVVTIAENETVDDTLLAAADTILIRGRVTGNLLAAGRRIVIDGTVEGNVIAFGELVTVRGTVGGLVLGAGSTFELEGASLDGDLYAAGDNVTVNEHARIGGNAAIAGKNATVEGSVGKDLYTFAELVELNGELGEDLEAFGDRVRLLDDAHIGGNARLRISDEEHFHRAPGARIDGDVEFLDMSEGIGETNRYARIEFYLWQIARLVSAVLVGVAILWLVPGLRTLSVGGGVNGLKTAGIGLVALVSVPIIAALVAITLVGVPLSLMAIVAWLLLIYSAKIVVGASIGRMMMGATKYSENVALVLLVGMAAIIFVVNLPAIGGFISFVLTVVGIGLITQWVFAGLSARDA